MKRLDPTAEHSLPQIAAVLGVTPRRLQQLAADGTLKAGPGGKYPLASTVQSYLAFLHDEDRKSSRTAGEDRIRDARAREIELRIARRENELIETEEAIGVLDEMVGIIRLECGGLGARVTRDLELRRRIEKEVNGIFTRAADRFEERASALRESGDAVTADAEDDA